MWYNDPEVKRPATQFWLYHFSKLRNVCVPLHLHQREKKRGSTSTSRLMAQINKMIQAKQLLA